MPLHLCWPLSPYTSYQPSMYPWHPTPLMAPTSPQWPLMPLHCSWPLSPFTSCQPLMHPWHPLHSLLAPQCLLNPQCPLMSTTPLLVPQSLHSLPAPCCIPDTPYMPCWSSDAYTPTNPQCTPDAHYISVGPQPLHSLPAPNVLLTSSTPPAGPNTPWCCLPLLAPNAPAVPEPYPPCQPPMHPWHPLPDPWHPLHSC